MKAKDYNLIASALAQAKYINKTSADTRVWERICLLEASALGAMDTKFNRDKFLQACGIEVLTDGERKLLERQRYHTAKLQD